MYIVFSNWEIFGMLQRWHCCSGRGSVEGAHGKPAGGGGGG